MRRSVMRPPQAVALALGGAVLLSGLTSCSASQHQMPAAHAASTRASAAPSNSSTLDPSAQAALASYEAGWKATDDASRTGRYQLSALTMFFSGDVLQVITQNLDTYEENGIVSKGAIALHPYVAVEDLRSNPPTVTIADCIDDRHDLLYYAATGKPIDDVPGGFRAETTVMSDLDGMWKATNQAMDGEGTCRLR